jgi:hypothetical protein
MKTQCEKQIKRELQTEREREKKGEKHRAYSLCSYFILLE